MTLFGFMRNTSKISKTLYILGPDKMGIRQYFFWQIMFVIVACKLNSIGIHGTQV